VIIILAYLCFAFSSWVFSKWVWNRCKAIGGTHGIEDPLMDYLFALAVVAAIYGIRNV
jgi:hypothetical protein